MASRRKRGFVLFLCALIKIAWAASFTGSRYLAVFLTCRHSSVSARAHIFLTDYDLLVISGNSSPNEPA